MTLGKEIILDYEDFQIWKLNNQYVAIDLDPRVKGSESVLDIGFVERTTEDDPYYSYSGEYFHGQGLLYFKEIKENPKTNEELVDLINETLIILVKEAKANENIMFCKNKEDKEDAIVDFVANKIDYNKCMQYYLDINKDKGEDDFDQWFHELITEELI